MAKGDHIKVSRTMRNNHTGKDVEVYTHHGIDCGDGTVVHFTGEPGQKLNAKVAETPMSEFKRDATKVEVVQDKSTRTPDEVVKTAKARVGETGYHLFMNNCEHFATDCRTGQPTSEQVFYIFAVACMAAGAAVVHGVGKLIKKL